MTICGWKHLGEGVEIYEPIVVLRPELIEIGDFVRVDSFCKLEGQIILGNRVHVASFAHIGPGGGHVSIGAHSGIASHAVIASGQPDLSYACICPTELPEDVHPTRYQTVIGKYVFIASGSIVLPGCTIGDYAIVKAGAVVTHDVPDWEIWAGIPARKVGERTLLK